MADNISSSHKDILLEAYKTRVQLLITQGNRLWTRFNYFLAIELALGALYYVYAKPIASVIGIIFSVLWYLIAANDNYFLKHDRRRVRCFEEDYLVPLSGDSHFKQLYTENIKIKRSWICFNVKPFRVTSFSVYIPVIFFLFWLAILIYNLILI